MAQVKLRDLRPPSHLETPPALPSYGSFQKDFARDGAGGGASADCCHLKKKGKVGGALPGLRWEAMARRARRRYADCSMAGSEAGFALQKKGVFGALQKKYFSSPQK